MLSGNKVSNQVTYIRNKKIRKFEVNVTVLQPIEKIKKRLVPYLTSSLDFYTICFFTAWHFDIISIVEKIVHKKIALHFENTEVNTQP